MLQSLLFKALRAVLASAGEELFAISKGVKVINKAKNIFSAKKVFNKALDVMVDKGLNIRSAKNYAKTFEKIKTLWDEDIGPMIDKLKAENLEVGVSVEKGMSDYMYQVLAKAFKNKNITPKKLEELAEKEIFQIGKELAGNVKAIKEKHLADLLDNIKRDDNLAQTLKDYTPFKGDQLQNFANELENRNWSIIAEIIQSISLAVDFLKAQGLKITKKLEREIYGEIFGVYPTSGRRIYKSINGKRIKTNTLFNHFQDYAYHVNDKRAIQSYVAVETADAVTEFVGKKLGINRRKNFKAIRSAYASHVAAVETAKSVEVDTKKYAKLAKELKRRKKR